MGRNETSARILKSWWRRNQSKPQALSLRSLAKKLDISPGYLSKIFAGKVRLPKELVEPLTKLMEFDFATEQQLLEALTRETLERNLGTKAKTQRNVKRSEPSPLDAYLLSEPESEWLLGQWYRTAILDLTTLADFKSDPKWISKRLGISVAEVEQSIRYLTEAGLLTSDSAGQLCKAHLHLRYPSTKSKKIYRQHHIEQMRRAIQYLEHATTPKDFNSRLMLSVTVACDKDKLDEVKAELHRAVYEAVQKLSSGESQEVYQLNLQLFPHTK